MYDGVPIMSKWITVHNGTDRKIDVDRMTAETLAVVEEVSWVSTPSKQAVDADTSPIVYPTPRVLAVTTDYSFGSGKNAAMANKHVVKWQKDRQFTSQVNYRLATPCLLVVRPDYGPDQTLKPGETFTSFRVFELVHDSSERERRGLATRRFYRTLAPWVTENPLTHHLQQSDPASVRRAIDQAAEVGFEMVIMSFGSGYNIENESARNIQKWKALNDYGKTKGIEVGGYSLLASRRIGRGHDVESPPGTRPKFGNSPCLCSQWGQDYFRKLYQFHDKTGASNFRT